MADWHIIGEDENFPEFPGHEPQPSPRNLIWRWALLLSGMVITVLIVGYFTLQTRLNRQVALHETLTTLINEEETFRLMGKRSQAELLLAPDAPQTWQKAYWNTFEDDNRPSAKGTIQLNRIDFEGRCAVVELGIENSQQVRAYCPNDQGWQRAPIPNGAWGYGHLITDLPHGASLHFLPRDQIFASALASDLREFFAAVTVILGEQPLYNGLEIHIEPHELQGPLVLDDEQHLVVNSPLLLPMKAEAGSNSSEATIRLVLAKALLRRTGPASAELPRNLPGVVRFLQAAQTIGALHLMPSLEAWHTPPGKQGAVIFPAYLSSQQDSFYLMADRIYRQCGLQTLMAVVQQLPYTKAWDDIFQHPLNRPSFVLASEVVPAEVQPDLGKNPGFTNLCLISSDSQ